MKKHLSILLLFISITTVASSVFASVTFTTQINPSLSFEDDPAFDLCDASCDFTISFPDGGTLTATDILLFNFGNGGVINLGEGGSINVSVQPESLDFSIGGTLFLTTGESITFGPGGFINTGASGNFKYSDIEVTTNVTFDVVLDAGSTQINLFNITATGTGNITISTDGIINVVGLLEGSEAGFNLIGVAPNAIPTLCNDFCDLTISFPDGGTLTASEELRVFFGPGGLISLGDAGTVNAATQPGVLEFPTGGSFVLDAGESISFDVGGSIRTGASGNFAYTDIELTTIVNFNIVLDEGSTSINLYDMTATGSGVISIAVDGDINVLGLLSVGESSLALDSGGAINFTDSTGAATAQCSSSTIDGSNLMLASSASFVTVGTECTGIVSVDSAISVAIDLSKSVTITISNEAIVANSDAGGAGSIDWMTFGALLICLLFCYRIRAFINKRDSSAAARMKCKVIRDKPHWTTPDYATLHPGYLSQKPTLSK